MNPIKPISVSTVIISVILTASCITAYSQEYTYDESGSLIKDNNKQIAQILYNHLNLPDTIIYTDGRKMIFTYTAFGVKLSEQTLAANGTLLQKRNYASQFLYSNDTLKEIQHEDGRAVPVLPGNSTTTWEYQYHLKDHLGNVRSTLTSKQEVDNSTATFETAAQIAEQNQFIRYEDARRINSYLFDHTDNGVSSYSERLSGSANEKYGLAKSLSVMPGDTIKLKVFAKYVDPNATDLKPVLTSLLGQIAASAAGVVVDGASYSTSTSSFPITLLGLVNTSGSSGNGPKAFLNWLVFDRNYIFKDGGFKRMGTAGKENGSNVAHEELSAELVIKEPGYVYVYLSNEESTSAPVEVYFDDFNVTQVKGPLIQQTDYDPFGLTFNEYSRENTAPNNFLYNGKELQKDFDLNWYDYGARMYDAALGRWHVIDPKAQKYASWSPYNYVMNNPVVNIDPDGQLARIHYGDGLFFDFDGSAQAVQDGLALGDPFVTAFIQAYQFDTENYRRMYGEADALEKIVTDPHIIIAVTYGNESDFYNHSPTGGSIYWDPYHGIATTSGHLNSPATALDHEAQHALDFIRAYSMPEAAGVGYLNLPDPNYGKKAEAVVIPNEETRQALANGEIEQGEVNRTDHQIKFYQVSGPTSTIMAKGANPLPLINWLINDVDVSKKTVKAMNFGKN